MWRTFLPIFPTPKSTSTSERQRTVEIGITDYAQGELGDIVYIELPTVGLKFSKHDVFAAIEVVKAVSELFAPVSGEVIAVNPPRDKEPAPSTVIRIEPAG